MTSADRTRALQSRRVDRQDLYRACSFKYNTVEDTVLSLYNAAWSGKAMALGATFASGAGGPSALALGAGLLAFEKLGTAPVAWIREAKREAQVALCLKTVEKYYLGEENYRSFLQSAEAQLAVPFSQPDDSVIRDLGGNTRINRIVELAGNGAAPSPNTLVELGLDENRFWQERTESFRLWLGTSPSAEERQRAEAAIAFESSERVAQIYLSQVALARVFGDEVFAQRFGTLATSLNTIYTTYQNHALNGLTYAATANYVGAGLALVSLFGSTGRHPDGFGAILKSIQQLTDIVIAGFNAMQESQQEILVQLRALTEKVTLQHEIELSAIKTVQDAVDGFRADYEQDRYTTEERVLLSAVAQLVELHRANNFNIAAPSFRVPYFDRLGLIAEYGTKRTADERTISGYTTNQTIGELVLKFEKVRSFEYLIGTVPHVHGMLGNGLTPFSPNLFSGDRRVPNPSEWCRAFYLYYQCVFSVGLEENRVRLHLEQFALKGRHFQDFCKRYTSRGFIEPVAELHSQLASRLLAEQQVALASLLAEKNYPHYQYLLANVSHQIGGANTLQSFAQNADLSSQSFVITSSANAMSYGKMLGYEVSFNFSQAISILGMLDLIEPMVYKRRTYRQPDTLKIEMLTTHLQFKGSPVRVGLVHQPDATKGFIRASIVAAQTVDDAGATYVGTKTARFGDVFTGLQLPPDYWQVCPANSPSTSSINYDQITFLDYFRNELVRAELKVRTEVLTLFRAQERTFLDRHRALADDVDVCGYLLAVASTIQSFNRKTSASFSYISIHDSKLEKAMTPVKPPLAFSRDIFSNFTHMAAKNGFSGLQDDEQGITPFWKFHQPIPETGADIPTAANLASVKFQAVEYAHHNMMLRIENQRKALLTGLDEDGATGNYNVSKIIAECELYLAQ
jgi:hypothetical protein